MSAGPDWLPTASPATLRARAEALIKVRQFFAERGVLEVQTPLLGAATVTDPEIQAFSVTEAPELPELPEGPEGVEAGQQSCGFLQTSTEYHQKRLLAAGVGDNYTLGPVFRSGETGRLHNPEFTMLEWYRLGFDDHALMREVEALVDQLLGPGEYQTHAYQELLYGVSLSIAEKRDIAESDQEDLRVARAIEALGAGRHFIVGYPAEAAVLAQLDPDDPAIARRFELVIDGVEIANGYLELLDLESHVARFARDNEIRIARQRAAVTVDEAFLRAVESGLPDCAGVALGFDRLLMLMLGAGRLSDVQAFGWSCR